MERNLDGFALATGSWDGCGMGMRLISMFFNLDLKCVSTEELQNGV